MNPGSYQEGSDAASYSDELSPTDGYFGQRSHPQELFVESPTRSSAEGSSKAQEVAEEPEAASGSSAHPSHSNRASMSPTWADESTPLLDAGPAPPAYSAAMASSYRQPLNVIGARQSEYGASGPAARSVFGGSRAPESMSGYRPVDEDLELYAAPKPYRQRRLGTFVGWTIKGILGVVVIAMIAWLVMLRTTGKSSTDNGHVSWPKTPDQYMPNFPGGCSLKSYSRVESFDFDRPSKFLLYEFLEDHESFSGSIAGEIRVVPAPPEQRPNLRVNLTVAVSDPYTMEKLHYTKTDTELGIKLPSVKRKSGKVRFSRPCMRIAVVMLVASDTALEDFEIAAANLNLKVLDGLDLTVRNATDITLLTGNLSARPFNSRETRIDLISGSVSGKYNLLDLLSIKTKSGSINVDVDPQEADKDHPAPAEFTADSTSGSIHVTFPTSAHADLPARDYRTTVSGDMGSVTGRFIHGSTTTLTTSSGSIAADLLPYAADDYASHLRTSSGSGTGNVDVLPPWKDPGELIKRMYSTHSAVAGSLRLRYPQEWAGDIEGETVSGSLNVRGRDVRVIRVGDEIPGRRKFVGKKGGGGGTLRFETVSGSVDLTVGDV